MARIRVTREKSPAPMPDVFGNLWAVDFDRMTAKREPYWIQNIIKKQDGADN